MAVDFFENGLCFHCHLAESELRLYSEFHHGVEDLWKKRDADHQQEIDDLLEKFPGTDHDDIVENHTWELHCNQIRFPSINRAALCVAIYSFVEDHLDRLCEIVQDSIGSKVRLKDITGQGMERALLYLSRVGSFDLGHIPGLARMKDIGLIRNALVHSGGWLPIDPAARVCKAVAEINGVAGKPGRQIELDAEFIYEYIASCVAFFQELNSEVKAFMARVDRSEA